MTNRCEKIFHQLSIASGAANLLTFAFGAAGRFSGLHAIYRLVCMRSPMLNEFWRPRCCAQGKRFQSVPAASQYAFQKVLKKIIRTLLGELSYASYAVFSAVKTHRYETIWLPPSHPHFRSRALFILFKALLWLNKY